MSDLDEFTMRAMKYAADTVQQSNADVLTDLASQVRGMPGCLTSSQVADLLTTLAAMFSSVSTRTFGGTP